MKPARWTPWLPVLAWTGLISLLSHDPQSAETSGWLVRLATWLWTAATGAAPDPGTLEVLHLGLRKAGHLAEYAVLYLLILRARILTGRGRGRAVPFLLCVAFAALDEAHQSFVPHRVGSPGDVLVDAAGAGLAALGQGTAGGRRT